MSSMSYHALVVGTLSLTISRGPARVATCTRPTALKPSILLLAIRCHCFTRARTIGRCIFVGTVMTLSVKHQWAERPLLHCISITFDVSRFAKLKNSLHSSRHTISAHERSDSYSVSIHGRRRLNVLKVPLTFSRPLRSSYSVCLKHNV